MEKNGTRTGTLSKIWICYKNDDDKVLRQFGYLISRTENLISFKLGVTEGYPEIIIPTNRVIKLKILDTLAYGVI